MSISHAVFHSTVPRVEFNSGNAARNDLKRIFPFTSATVEETMKTPFIKSEISQENGISRKVHLSTSAIMELLKFFNWL